MRVDVSDERDVQQAYDALEQRIEHLDILVNNAAIDITEPIDELDPEAWGMRSRSTSAVRSAWRDTRSAS